MRNEILRFLCLAWAIHFSIFCPWIGTGDVLDAIVENLPHEEVVENPDMIKFSLIGRPNVGKSSLINAILGDRASLPVLYWYHA